MLKTKQRLQYSIDNLFARGTSTLLLLLGVSVLLLLLILVVLMWTLGESAGVGSNGIDDLWTLFVYTFDPTGVPYSEGSWTYKMIMLTASIGGVFILSTLVGILSTGFAESLATLRKGKSVVAETNHTLVLGWGEQIFSVVHELITANSNVRKACVVILAEQDKVFMEDELRARIPDFKTTTVVCRSGSPMDTSDLTIVRPEHAKSIIILDTQLELASQSDAITVKILLALHHVMGHTTQSVVATMRDEANIQVARLVAANAHIIPSELVISQIITQTCRQPGLSLVYSELLDFDGDELYVYSSPDLVGKSFAKALLCFDGTSLIGIKYASGEVKVNPPMNTIIQPGDSVIVLSADDDTIYVTPTLTSAVQQEHIVQAPSLPNVPENILVLGWNDRGKFILRELDNYVPTGTQILLVDEIDRSIDVAAIQEHIHNYTITARIGSTFSRDTLETLEISTFSSIIVLADTSVDVQSADAQSLMTLIHLRDICSKQNVEINIVTEMLDERNKNLAAADSVNDFIISNTITSLLLTQIAENIDLYQVFRDLFDAEGSELYLKPVSNYVTTDTPVTFATVVAAASRRNEIAIGCKFYNNGNVTVQLNLPKKNEFSFSHKDMIIVVAEH